MKDEKIIYIYTGAGQSAVGLPARDLTQAHVAAIEEGLGELPEKTNKKGEPIGRMTPAEYVAATGLYKAVKESK